MVIVVMVSLDALENREINEILQIHKSQEMFKILKRFKSFVNYFCVVTKLVAFRQRVRFSLFQEL